MIEDAENIKHPHIMEKQLLNLLLPKKWQACFDLQEIIEKEKEVIFILVEKKELIPEVLKGKEVVMNGYLDPVEIIDFPARGKLVYLKFQRRRWKEQGKDESYHNTYSFHRKGMKTTDEFGDFLKALDRKALDEFLGAWSGVRDCWEKDLLLVSERAE